MADSPEYREYCQRRLAQLKERIDAVHEIILRALRRGDEAAVDQAMEEQHTLMQEYAALRRETRQPEPT